ncbi:MAG: hypothetical protein U5K54_04605 [Cytophagales bacterium]|nr:hypothetical protein [Cytophagales bacterium]
METSRREELDKIVDEYNECIANANKDKVLPSSEVNEKSVAITTLIAKVEAQDFASKKDALDLLRDIQGRVNKTEIHPKLFNRWLKRLFD